MSYDSHLAVNIAEARSIGAANPSDHPYTAGGTAEATNESRHGQGSGAPLGALARTPLFTAILHTLWLAVHLGLAFFVRMVENGRFLDASRFLAYLDIVLALCAAALLATSGSYMWSISDALRGMLANDMVIAIFAVAQSLVDIPSRNMVLVVSGSEEHAGLVLFSRFCQAISATLQGIPPTVSQWVTGNSGVNAEELKTYATAISTSGLPQRLSDEGQDVHHLRGNMVSSGPSFRRNTLNIRITIATRTELGCMALRPER